MLSTLIVASETSLVVQFKPVPAQLVSEIAQGVWVGVAVDVSVLVAVCARAAQGASRAITSPIAILWLIWRTLIGEA
jgi:hypothetical protein